MGLYEDWKGGKAGAHQIMALLSAYHRGQVNGAEATAIMDDWGFSTDAKNEMVIVYNRLVAGTLDREELDNAFMLGDIDSPGFETKQNFISRIT